MDAWLVGEFGASAAHPDRDRIWELQFRSSGAGKNCDRIATSQFGRPGVTTNCSRNRFSRELQFGRSPDPQNSDRIQELQGGGNAEVISEGHREWTPGRETVDPWLVGEFGASAAHPDRD